MSITEKKTEELEGYQPDDIPWQALMERCRPVVLKGLVDNWKLVEAGRRSAADAIAYLHSYYNGKTVGAYYGPPEIAGRYFYNDDVSGLNFESRRSPLDEVLATLKEHLETEEPPSIYVGSTTIDACLPARPESRKRPGFRR